ncbi:MAG TPA: D-alanyl-D-alanine carboxypeptidase family protein [Chthoniobacterales bacterium]
MDVRFFQLLPLAVIFAACTSVPEPVAVRQAIPSQPVALAPVGAPAVWPAEAPAIYAQSAILIDAHSGRVLYQKNADIPRPVASTQKLLTALVVARDGDLDQIVQVARADTQVEPTKLGLRTGERYSRRHLLEAMLVKSCNDTAAALARDHSGSVPAFSAEMNQLAAQIGATSSHFANPHGLPASQYSTARDMARIAYRAYRIPALRVIMARPVQPFVFNNGRVRYLENTNKLLKRSSLYTGMKTGYTDAAGRCLVTSASNGWRDLILVQLGSKTRYIFDDAERLIASAYSFR